MQSPENMYARKRMFPIKQLGVLNCQVNRYAALISRGLPQLEVNTALFTSEGLYVKSQFR